MGHCLVMCAQTMLLWLAGLLVTVAHMNVGLLLMHIHPPEVRLAVVAHTL